MTNSNSITDFIKELRRENTTTCPWEGQQRFHTLCINRYAGDKKEWRALVDKLEDRLSNVEIIDRIRLKLEHENIPAINKLAAFTQKLSRIFSKYATAEPATAGYLNRILSGLKSFQGIVNAGRQYDQQLSVGLRSLLSGRPANEISKDFFSAQAGLLIEDIERYIDELQRYYDVFGEFLQHETQNERGLKLTTRIEQGLLELTGLIEQSVYYSVQVKRLFTKWEKALALAEQQAEYN